MIRKVKMVSLLTAVLVGLVLSYLICINTDISKWWLDKIGLVIKTDNRIIQYMTANLLDVIVSMLIIAVVIFIVATIDKFIRR